MKDQAAYLFCLGECDLCCNSNGQDVLEAIDDGMRHTGWGWVPDLQAESSHVGHTFDELGVNVLISDVQDAGMEHRACLVH